MTSDTPPTPPGSERLRDFVRKCVRIGWNHPDSYLQDDAWLHLVDELSALVAPVPVEVDCLDAAESFVRKCREFVIPDYDEDGNVTGYGLRPYGELVTELATAFGARVPADVRAAAERLTSNSWDEYIGEPGGRDWMVIADKILFDGRTVARHIFSAPRPATEADGRAGDDDEAVTPTTILQELIDDLQVPNSLGVSGSDFTTCLGCNGGSYPGKDGYVHQKNCPVEKAEKALTALGIDRAN